MKIKHNVIEKKHYVDLEFETTEDFEKLCLVEVCKIAKVKEDFEYRGAIFKVQINSKDFYFFWVGDVKLNYNYEAYPKDEMFRIFEIYFK